MSSVGQKNTGPEMRLRSALHRRGLRYRLHDRSLPGSPDLILTKYRAVIFVHGCYWHRHGCYRTTSPKTRSDFWEEKFAANEARDRRDVDRLLELGWRVLVVWECALIGKTSRFQDAVADEVIDWLQGPRTYAEISGKAVENDVSRVPPMFVE